MFAVRFPDLNLHTEKINEPLTIPFRKSPYLCHAKQIEDTDFFS